MLKNIYIIGHRGTGKSTTARLAARMLADKALGLDHVDLDDVIEAGEDQTCAEIIADSEPRFRDLERQYLAEITSEQTSKPRIIALGGGFHPVPDDGAVIWMYRDGWQDVARSARAQLRPDTDFAAEVDWMISEREPRWEDAAHLRIDVPRGRGPERTAHELATAIGWLLELDDSALAGRTWVVPAGPEQLERAARDAKLFGLAGVEVRSDLMSAEDAGELSVDVLASLRTSDSEWLATFEDAAALDIDVSLLDEVLEAGVLDRMSPRPLLLSWHPSESVDEWDDRLVVDAMMVAEHHPEWSDDVILKYAPTLTDYAELREHFEAVRQLRDEAFDVTFLPQGAQFAWCRPPLALQNATNYVPVGLGPHRRRHTDNPVKTPLDLQGWLPHLAGPEPTRFEALVGDPVESSQGDVWHRRAARDEGPREDGQVSSYLKIPFGREQSTDQLELLLDCAADLGVCGLSITSPLKRTILEPDGVVNPEDLSAANTLRRVYGTWEATDTDEFGMRATLEAAKEQGVAPGSVAIIGRGGVSPAVLRAISESDWELVHHASGRKGWTDEAPGEVQMVVNAAGDSDTAYADAPDCEVWVDLHYSGVRAAPEGVRVHLIGDTFFDAQAKAQRSYWYP
ncbi:MAG: shikimate kinase [Persicimonas sp.]